MAMMLDLALIPKKALFIPSSKSREDELVFPLPELFSNLGFALDTLPPRETLALEQVREISEGGVLVLDIRLWDEETVSGLTHVLCDQLPRSVLLWYCPRNSGKILNHIPEQQLRTMFFFHHDSTRRCILPLLIMASSAQMNRHRWIISRGILVDLALDSSQEGILGMNPDNFILYANATALKILGLSLGQVLYQFRDQFFQIEKPPRADQELGMRPHLLLRRFDDKVLKVSYRELPVHQAGWDMTLMYFQDISKELETLAAINTARLEAQKAAKTKSDFLANISHELRTPLNSILGMTDLALQLADNKEQEEYLRILQISGNSLLQLITSMLDYIKLESGVISLKEKAFPLNELFDSIAAQFAIQCHNKGLGFHVVADERAPVFYIGDETRVKQVLLNLVSNAFKFTSRGEIVIRFKELPVESGKNHMPSQPEDGSMDYLDQALLEFQVIDTGIGIGKKQQDEIFQPFVQLNVSDQTNTPGTGIGLTITKLLVNAMGGDISVMSEPNRGAIFTFTCRLMRGAVRRQADFNPSFMHVKTIIAVGDSWGWYDSLQTSLASGQCRVIFCRHTNEVETALLTGGLDDVLFFFQGAYSETEALFALLGRPQYGSLVNRKHFLTLRLTVDAEKAWHSAPFPYKVIYEPLRGTSLVKILVDMELELNRGDRDAAYGQYHSPYDLELYYVEDEGLNRIATSRVLSEAGHRVNAFGDGMQLIKALEGAKPDFFLLDIEIPYFSGYEIATRIRRGEFGEDLRNIPIIALTAHDTMEEKHQAEQVGIDAFLAKPFSPQTLLVVIDRVWERFLDGKTAKRPSQQIKSDMLEQTREAIAAGQWMVAQNLIQDYREQKKSTMSKEVNEMTFRLLLQIRRTSGDSAVEILDKLQRYTNKGVEYEDPRR